MASIDLCEIERMNDTVEERIAVAEEESENGDCIGEGAGLPEEKEVESSSREETEKKELKREEDEARGKVQDQEDEAEGAEEKAQEEAEAEEEAEEEDEMQTVSICTDSHVVEEGEEDSPSSSPHLTASGEHETRTALSSSDPSPNDHAPSTLKIKVVLVGDSGVGKSCILFKILGLNTADCDGTTIGVDLRSKEIVVDEQPITLQLYDTAGQARFRSITRAYYRGADAVILVYDITNQESFNNAKEWAQELLSNAKSKCNILLGNKCDLEEKRVVSSTQGQQLANKFGFIFMETNIVDSKNIDITVAAIARVVKSKIAPTPEPQCAKRDYVSIKVAPSPVLASSKTLLPDDTAVRKPNKSCLLPLYAWCGY